MNFTQLNLKQRKGEPKIKKRCNLSKAIVEATTDLPPNRA